MTEDVGIIVVPAELLVCRSVGIRLECLVGASEGSAICRKRVGKAVGLRVGALVGCFVGSREGLDVSCCVKRTVGRNVVGSWAMLRVGNVVASDLEGFSVGFIVGTVVGGPLGEGVGECDKVVG